MYTLCTGVSAYQLKKCAYIHLFCAFSVYQWSLNGTVATNLKNPSNVWGIIALASVDLIFVFSTEFWRGKAYNFFLSTHILGFTLILPAVSHLIHTWCSAGCMECIYLKSFRLQIYYDELLSFMQLDIFSRQEHQISRFMNDNHSSYYISNR